ncbi:MAG: acyl-ACP--UDP-N-acetylglucosamine O-acyltransferase [Alphaproteobacteria bacterium]|nr:acyl-ACP--UDP-N-acetylglucosamine O-acyltransferase [Alphaproteobacteria bacterium]
MTEIHSTAIVDSGAEIGNDVSIGSYCTIGKNVKLCDGVKLVSHVVITGHTTVGENTRVSPFAVLGQGSQHTRYMDEEEARLEIGKNNIIREHVTMHLGTPIDNMVTKVGNDGFFMVGSHIAHDCIVGNNVTMINNATLGGHVKVDDFVIIGGMSAVHQFCRIGKQAMIGGMTGVEQDVIPYGMVTGDRARLNGLNIVGLRRRGHSRRDIKTLRQAYRLLFAKEGTFAERIEDVEKLFKDNKEVMDIIGFMQAASSRNICQPE